MTQVSLANMRTYTLKSFSGTQGKKKVQYKWIAVTGHLIELVLRANIVYLNACNRSLAHQILRGIKLNFVYFTMKTTLANTRDRWQSSYQDEV